MSARSSATSETDLERELRQAQALLERREALARNRARSEDTRRKILVGAVLLEEIRQGDAAVAAGTADPDDSMTSAWLRELLDTGLVRDRDRALFGLPLRPVQTGPERPCLPL